MTCRSVAGFEVSTERSLVLQQVGDIDERAQRAYLIRPVNSENRYVSLNSISARFGRCEAQAIWKSGPDLCRSVQMRTSDEQAIPPVIGAFPRIACSDQTADSLPPSASLPDLFLQKPLG